MYFQIDDYEMYYEVIGEGEPLIVLHGWEKSHFDFLEFATSLTNTQVILVDFLNFGFSDKCDEPLSVDDYTDQIKRFIDYLNLKNPIIMGHSFGGRVAIRYASKYIVKKLILANSAGIRPKRTFKYYLKRYKYKISKRIFYLFSKKKYDIILHSGSDEYRRLDKVMRKTFSKVVNYDLKFALKKIKVPVLIIAGVNDKIISFQDAITMNSLLENSKLIPFYHSGHFTYQDEYNKFRKVVETFLKE